MVDNQNGEKVFFSQKPPAGPWVSEPYWEGTVENNGCGMISLTMCVDILTGAELTPSDMIRIRNEAGIDQLHVFDKERRSVCGGDAHPFFNPDYAELFGIQSLPLERSLNAFKEALAQPDTVIWASCDGLVFHDVNGVTTDRTITMGHVVTIWKYEDGIFYVKDCHYQADLGNNVPYTDEEMEAFIKRRAYQQYAIRKL